MAISPYRDFVLKIEPAGDGYYRAEVDGHAGQAQAYFQLPFDQKDLEIFVLKVGRPRSSSSRGVPKPMTETATFGKKLYDAVFNGDVRDVFVRARYASEQHGHGLRLKLRLNNAPELADLPWEFLFDGHDYLALLPDLPIVHHLDLPHPPRPLGVNLPLRVLVTISSPENMPPLNVEAEKAKLLEALSGLIDRGLVQVDFTPDAMLRSLQRTLRAAGQQPYHVWHFIGHGGFDPVSQSSVLVLCDEYSRSHHVDGFTLGTLFAGHKSTRLVVMNACEGARPDPEDPFAGVAAAVVERGIPAVIGMQFEITDRAAITFTDEFYTVLASGMSVEAALTEARRAIYFTPNHVEWATPVLFMRVDDGVLFDISEDGASPIVELDEPASPVRHEPIPDSRKESKNVLSLPKLDTVQEPALNKAEVAPPAPPPKLPATSNQPGFRLGHRQHFHIGTIAFFLKDEEYDSGTYKSLARKLSSLSDHPNTLGYSKMGEPVPTLAKGVPRAHREYSELELTYDEKMMLDKVFCIALISGQNDDGDPCYSYINCRGDRLENVLSATSNRIVMLGDYATFLKNKEKGQMLFGLGTPTKLHREWAERDHLFSDFGAQVRLFPPLSEVT